ncbi:MarR family winged helix-turn-helix transcriptional regulator [Hydrogenophaga sp.]|jgi:DNA-binding MarR family transcriptional regulator|uniref:MarR family winged helix-turn-helix transcriptional regulator n=1 Tax=Hydrogenophaga sp. TaxID=1904254 RepID=UPI003F6F490B
MNSDGSIDQPRGQRDLLNYRLKTLFALSGAPGLRLFEGGFGIARAEWRLLAILVEDGAMSPTQLATRAHMESARASRLITSLMGKQLVLRVELETDRRRAVLQATEAAHALFAQIFPLLVKINAELVEVLDAAEREVFEQCLRKLTGRARELADRGVAPEVSANRWMGSVRRDEKRKSG